VELSAGDGEEQSFGVGIEVEARKGSTLVMHRLRQLVELVAAVAWIFDRGQELRVSPVGGFQDFPQRGETVDGLLHRRPLGFLGAVVMFYLAVVLEKRLDR
jgi:hypothetical protein